MSHATNATLERIRLQAQENRALANVARQQILICVLARGDEGIRTTEIADTIDEPVPSVSKGLRALEQCSLVKNVIAKEKDGISSRYYHTERAKKWYDCAYEKSPTAVVAAMLA